MVAPKAKSIYDMSMSDFDDSEFCAILGDILPTLARSLNRARWPIPR
jgi:hypothetical protein